MAVYLPGTKTRHAFIIMMMMTKLKNEMNINEYGNDERIEFYVPTEYYWSWVHCWQSCRRRRPAPWWEAAWSLWVQDTKWRHTDSHQRTWAPPPCSRRLRPAGETFQWAGQEDHRRKVFNWILQRGERATLPPSPPQVTPLYLACRHNVTNSALLLLSLGAHHNPVLRRYDGSVYMSDSLLYQAVWNNNSAVCRSLLANGANQDYAGSTWNINILHFHNDTDLYNFDKIVIKRKYITLNVLTMVNQLNIVKALQSRPYWQKQSISAAIEYTIAMHWYQNNQATV